MKYARASRDQEVGKSKAKVTFLGLLKRLFALVTTSLSFLILPLHLTIFLRLVNT